MYVAIPIEIAGTVKLMTTPVDNSNLIGGICFFGIKSYTILLKSIIPRQLCLFCSQAQSEELMFDELMFNQVVTTLFDRVELIKL